jgi:medium-chain acyl-[acyl-carrier-protein] hydrolase
MKSLSKNYQILVNDADFLKKLKLSAAFNFFQETAALHTNSLGIGFNTIQENFGVAWLLIRMRVDIIRYPVWNEEITVDTWHQIPRKLEFDRD